MMLEITSDLYSKNKDICMDITTRASDLVTKIKFLLLLSIRPFAGFKNSHFPNEAKCKTFDVKMSFICMRIENHFHSNGCALSLPLKQRLGPTRRWPKTDFTALSYILINYLLCYHRQDTTYVEKKVWQFSSLSASRSK